MKTCTLCYLIKDNQILLGLKKRGFGENRLNGLGGKVKPNETVEESAIRELQEEARIKVKKEHLHHHAKINFSFLNNPDWDQEVHVFLIKRWQGQPQETEEMKPQWFNLNNIPYSKMWPDDPHWLPLVLKEKKIKANFIFKNNQIKDFDIQQH